MLPKCSVSPLVDRHFAALIQPEEERHLRAHLPDCVSCRTRYERRWVLAKLDPLAKSAEQRIARGLGIRPHRKVPSSVFVSLAGLAVACALLVFVVPHTNSITPGFRARGTALPQTELEVRVVDAAGVASPAPKTVRGSDELAFRYRNESSARYLLVFGMDEHGHLHWYYPQWTDPATDPQAVSIVSGREWVELPDAVRHPLDGAELTVHGVFLDEPISVREMEKRVAGSPPSKALDARTRTVRLRIAR